MIEFFNIRDVVTRLNRTVPDYHGDVADVVNFALAIEQKNIRDHAVFCVPSRDRASPSQMDNGIAQSMVAEFIVLHAVRNVRDAGGGESLITLNQSRQLAAESLLGFKVSAHATRCEFVSGRLYGFFNAATWWADTYRTALPLRKL